MTARIVHAATRAASGAAARTGIALGAVAVAGLAVAAHPAVIAGVLWTDMFSW
jgi:hypothetical protein